VRKIPPSKTAPHARASAAPDVASRHAAQHWSLGMGRDAIWTFPELCKEVTSVLDNAVCRSVSPAADNRKHVSCSCGYTFDNPWNTHWASIQCSYIRTVHDSRKKKGLTSTQIFRCFMTSRFIIPVKNIRPKQLYCACELVLFFVAFYLVNKHLINTGTRYRTMSSTEVHLQAYFCRRLVLKASAVAVVSRGQLYPAT
jgi:hypothetical protein